MRTFVSRALFVLIVCWWLCRAHPLAWMSPTETIYLPCWKGKVELARSWREIEKIMDPPPAIAPNLP